MGGNDDGDDEKFPEPPDRPSSAHVAAPMSHSAGDVSARPGDHAAPILRSTQPNSSRDLDSFDRRRLARSWH
ncbi:hypothetical protein GGQ11_000071 [Salinibacter ruber]|nr:hypothetical protein [Salinibacter ruber]MCS4116472.1 hypothetical protein [Salinibacter ruber]MCS4185693.1 hypothetical protein [Salinibacter ruber]